MKRPATWKVVTVGAALTGLGVLGAGTAVAQPPEQSSREDSQTCCVHVRGDDDGRLGGKDASPEDSRLLGLLPRR
ncbi:hypothetical protein [Mycobacterium spongiae]|uniref:Secreted protein n=1 Tax=Mycobacterium spongiae TaxID=886343 RepID=A0A975JVU4_9MYCO|nr:hypothetical protein [Mycobacterium spongiae]QUR66318.1 hypothetical protein F6B93_03745 [Mycobacterium spongiae]